MSIRDQGFQNFICLFQFHLFIIAMILWLIMPGNFFWVEFLYNNISNKSQSQIVHFTANRELHHAGAPILVDMH